MAYQGTKLVVIGDMVLLAGAFTVAAHLHLVHPEMPHGQPPQPLQFKNIASQTTSGSTFFSNSGTTGQF